jgi:hypothetical protein
MNRKKKYHSVQRGVDPTGLGHLAKRNGCSWSNPCSLGIAA